MKERKLKAADLFCGGGGFTTGAEASGRVDVVLAVNHWRTAIYTHQKNHPETRHICARIDDIDPRNDKSLPELDLLLASPECTHHSIARGGKPIDDQKRATPWHVLVWAESRRPKWVVVENVREFRDWGPLDKHCRSIKARKGEIFQQWIKSLEAIGYQVDCQLLNAADFGAATSRTRLFIVARLGRRRKDIPWPEITHPKGNWKPAWSIIDWSIPCPSIFTRKRPLAEKTLRRIEAGLKKFCGQAFQFKAIGRNPGASKGLNEPLPTIVAARENHAVPFVVQFNNHCDATSISSPVSAITTSGAHHGLCLPFMLNYHGGNKEGRDGTERAADVNEPMPVIPTENRYGLVLPFLVPHFGEREGQSPRTHDINEPSPTITGQGAGSLVMPYLMDVNHGDDRFGIAMVSLIQTMNELGVVDIGFRMLDPDELSRAQGFPDDYHYHGTRAEQVRQIGNAVCPPVAKALCETIAEAA